MGKRFCIICGRSEDEVRLVGETNICVECFVKLYGLVAVPRIKPIPRCRVCGSIYVGGKWMPAGSFEEAVRIVVEKVIIPSLKPSRREVGEYRVKSWRVLKGPSWTTLLELRVEARLAGVEVGEEKQVRLRFKPTICPSCATYRSGEYEAVVQVRGRGAEEALEKALGMLGSRTEHVLDVLEVKGGYDVYFDEIGAARRLARLISSISKAKVSETGEVVGTNRSGRRRLRKTIIVRLH